jgi:ABC-2 type transport system permease protein
VNKIWAVIRREFIERVRTRAFLIGTLLFPVLMVGLSLMPLLLEGRETAPKRIAVVDGASGDVGVKVRDALAASRRDGQAGSPGIARYSATHFKASGRVGDVRDSLIALVGVGKADAETFDGILVLEDESVNSGRVPYLGVNVGSPGDMRKLEDVLQTSLRLERLIRAGVDPYLAMPALRNVDLQTQKIASGRLTGESGSTSFLLAYIMGFVLYLALVLYGVQVMTSVVEEKTNRISEVLVSSLSPFQMMLGKVIGVGSVGLLQLGIWGATAMLVTTYRAPLARLFGASPQAAAAFKVPEFRPDLLAVFLVFFILGFLLFSAAYAAVAAMCNSPQEAQQANTPVTMTIMAGWVAMFSLLNEPSGSLARTLSLVPVLAPFVVPVRYSLAPIPLPELLLSALLLLAAMLLVVWVAGRIYRVGILMYGKRPKLSEVWRWVRAS